jgi:hypothetical protein
VFAIMHLLAGLRATIGGQGRRAEPWYTPVVADMLKLGNAARVASQARLCSVLWSVLGTEQEVFGRPYRLNRQILKGGSILECAK